MRQHLNKCEFHRHTDRQTYRHLALFRLVKVFSSFELSCFDLYAPICSNWENWENMVIWKREELRRIRDIGGKICICVCVCEREREREIL